MKDELYPKINVTGLKIKEPLVIVGFADFAPRFIVRGRHLITAETPEEKALRLKNNK